MVKTSVLISKKNNVAFEIYINLFIHALTVVAHFTTGNALM